MKTQYSCRQILQSQALEGSGLGFAALDHQAEGLVEEPTGFPFRV